MFNKILDLLRGENPEVHKTKNKYTVEMIRIHTQAKRQVVTSQRTVEMIESSTAYRIAKATGKLQE